jgi:hypothetical protein
MTSNLMQPVATLSAEPRTRVRKHTMMKQLDVSQRTFQTLMIHGMPYTRFRGLLWFEPAKIHAWLDRFERIGGPGIRRRKGQRDAASCK